MQGPESPNSLSLVNTLRQLKSPFLERSPLSTLRPLRVIASDTVYNFVALSHSTKDVLCCLRGRGVDTGSYCAAQGTNPSP